MGPPFAVLSGVDHRARPGERGPRRGWHHAPPRDARPAPVPASQQVFHDYHGVAWYWTVFGRTGAADGERICSVQGRRLPGRGLGERHAGRRPRAARRRSAGRPEAAGQRGSDLPRRPRPQPLETPIDGIVLKRRRRHKASAIAMPGPLQPRASTPAGRRSFRRSAWGRLRRARRGEQRSQGARDGAATTPGRRSSRTLSVRLETVGTAARGGPRHGGRFSRETRRTALPVRAAPPLGRRPFLYRLCRAGGRRSTG